MTERLRGKLYLGRRLVDRVYRYRARASSADLSTVHCFVECNLDGLVLLFLAGDPHRSFRTPVPGIHQESWPGSTPTADRPAIRRDLA